MIKRVSIALLCLFLIGLVSYCLLGAFTEYSEGENRYGVLKDHGSLIAGLIGFGGVIWLIWNQNQETRKMIEHQNETTEKVLKDSNRRYELEKFERLKDRASEGIHIIEEKVFRVIPHSAQLVEKNQRFINTALFDEEIFSIVRTKSKDIDRFLDHYGDELSKEVFYIIRRYFLSLNNILHSDNDSEIIRVNLMILWDSIANATVMQMSENVRKFSYINYNGERIFLKDIRYMVDDLDVNSLDDVIIFMEIVYAWIRHYSMRQVKDGIESTIFERQVGD